MNSQQIAHNLSKWYQKNKRDLPFRETNDPYRIWISEIMAQQTQISQLLPYYQRWITLWPTIESLAQASIDEVNKAWEGLGYYRRASHILKTSQILVQQYAGQFPKTHAEILSLPGIGPYTAGAICSIAYELPTAAVDGNVIRVLSRWLGDDADFSKIANKRKLETMIEEFMLYQQPSVINQALMELGALVCTFRNPSCAACPLRHSCKAYQSNEIEKYPFQKPKKEKVIEHYRVFLHIQDHQLLISNDDRDGLMKGFVRLPQIKEDFIPFKQARFISQNKHVFSHKIWQMDVYEVFEPLKKLSSTQYIPIQEIEDYAWITAHKKILLDYLANNS